MIKQRIHISTLHVRLPRNISGLMGDERILASGIGREILKHIAGVTQGHSGKITIENITAGKIGMRASMGEIQKQIGTRVAAGVTKTLVGGRR